MLTKLNLSVFSGVQHFTSKTYVDATGASLSDMCATDIVDVQYQEGTLTFLKQDGSSVLVSGFPTLDDIAVGPTGPTGPTGAPGKDGKNGTDGKRGDRGCVGVRGPRGNHGKDGKPPATGNKGVPGIPGKVGPTGPTGAAGPQGPAGAVGPVGPKGERGRDGINGEVIYASLGGAGINGTNAKVAIVVSAADPGAVGAGTFWVTP